MPEKSKKILIFSTAYRPFIGGSEIAIEQIIRRLPDLFFDIVTPKYRSSLANESYGNVAIHRVGWGMSLDKYLFPLLGFLKGIRLTMRGSYSALHAYQASYGALAACLLRLFRRIPFLITLQEGKDLRKQSLFVRITRAMLLRHTDRVTTISSYLADYVREVAPEVLVTVIPNGVDPDTFKSDASRATTLRSELDIRDGQPVVITISRLVPKNGIDLLLQAVPSIRNDAVTVIVGDGSEKEKLYAQAVSLGIEQRVRWISAVPYAQVPEYLSMADVFVRPSRSEGLGTAFLEAMAQGVPIVAPAVGGIVDFLQDGITGLETNLDPRTIADTVNRLIEDQPLRESLVKKARELVLARFTWDVVAHQMGNFYAFL